MRPPKLSSSWFPAARLGALAACIALTASIAFGSGCAIDSNDGPCSQSGACNSGAPKGEVHGLQADGRVDVTAAQAWPGRPTEPTPITLGEIAQACARLGACSGPTDRSPTAVDDTNMGWATALCAAGDPTEERAIPMAASNERYSFMIRELLVAKSCDDVKRIKTDRSGAITCEEDGCYWLSATMPIPTVTCAGDVATLVSAGQSSIRDCSRSYTHCSPASATGCTDRATVACDSAGTDRCDGDVKLGCDSSGRVSYHDCALIDSHCVQDAAGAHCQAPVAKESCDTATAPSACVGGLLSVCVTGNRIAIDCTALGFTSCTNGHCM